MQGNNQNPRLIWSVLVNGEQYLQYKSFSFSRNIKNQCGEYSLVTTNTRPIDYPVQLNDEIVLKFGDVTVFTGWGDRLQCNGGISGTEIEVTGRDKNICDLVDSSVPDSVKNIKGKVSLRKLAESCMSALGIKSRLIDNTKDKLSDKSEEQQQTARSGQTIGDFLAKFAAKNQLYLIADSSGDLIVYKTESTNSRSTQKLIYGYSDNRHNNVLDASLEIDLTEVFAKIKVRGQGAIGYSKEKNKSSKSVDVHGDASEMNARPTRYLEIAIDEPTTTANATQRAIDEVNLRNGRSLKYRVHLPFFWDTNGSPFEIGQLFEIEDDLHQIMGSYLLVAFAVNFDIDAGTSAMLEFAPPSAYSVIEFDTKSERRRKRKRYIKRQNKKQQEEAKEIK